MNEEKLERIETKVNVLTKQLDNTIKRVTNLEKNKEKIETKERREFFPCKTPIDENGNILFNNNKQILEIDNQEEVFNVFSNTLEYADHSNNFVWIPCRRARLKLGDTAYRTDDEYEDFTKPRRVCKILDNECYVFIHGFGEVGQVVIDNEEYEYWYKLINKEELEDW